MTHVATLARAAGGPGSVRPTGSFSPAQVRRGGVLLVAFVALRAALTWAFPPEPMGSALEPRFLAYAGLAFVLGSVGLVYLGFGRWVGVDLLGWWADRRHLRGDLGWGLIGLAGGVGLTLALSLAVVSTGAAAAPPPGAAPSAAEYAALLVFGLAVASFQEETLFRGFLQTCLAERIGSWPAIVAQAAAFSLAHVGYAPLTAWPLYAAAAALGVWLGWLCHRRGRLLAPGLAHGLLG
jgi:membrane protease YdiL (CAAX protease family)